MAVAVAVAVVVAAVVVAVFVVLSGDRFVVDTPDCPYTKSPFSCNNEL